MVVQVTVINKGETECYECKPKQTPKVHPICTIRRYTKDRIAPGVGLVL